MKSEIILKNVNLDFPIYDVESLSIRNKISNFGKVIVNKTSINKSGSPWDLTDKNVKEIKAIAKNV